MPPPVADGVAGVVLGKFVEKVLEVLKVSKELLDPLVGVQQSSLGGKGDVVKDFCSTQLTVVDGHGNHLLGLGIEPASLRVEGGMDTGGNELVGFDFHDDLQR